MEADEKRQAKIAAFLGANSATAQADRANHHLDTTGHGHADHDGENHDHDLGGISEGTAGGGGGGGAGELRSASIVITESDELAEAD